MNTETKIWLGLIALVGISSVVFYATRLGTDNPTVTAPSNETKQGKQGVHDHSPKEKGPADSAGANANQTLAGAWPPPSLGAAPEFQLTSQTGKPFDAAQLAGRVWIANFIFTRCGATCPEQTKQFALLQDACRTNPNRKGVQLVSITVDPEYDQPEVLRAYAEQAGAKPGWHFLTGDREAIWKLSKEGFHLPVNDDAKNQKMPIMHDSKFVLIDRQGKIRGYFDLLNSVSRKAMSRALDHVLPEMRVSNDMDGSAIHLSMPPENLDIDWFAAREDQQKQTLQSAEVPTGIRFRHSSESGIDYNPQIVDEQRWRLKVNHYDHGTCVAVADVDGDKRLDLYFVSQAGANALYRNLGNGQFADITAQAGVGLANRIGVAAAFADIDNDGDVDLFVTTVRGGNVLFRNDGGGVFEDISESAGVGYNGHSSGAVFFDYDRDGRLDLFVTNVGKYTTDELVDVRIDGVSKLKGGPYSYYLGTGDSFAGHLKPELSESSILYRNLGDAVFQDVTEETGLIDKSWSGAAMPLDVNRDGWLDLYVLNMQGNDSYWESQEGKRFLNKTPDVFPQTPWGSMGIQTLDFDNNGLFDIFITDMHSDMSEDVGPELEKAKSNMQWAQDFLATKPGESIFGNAFFKNAGGKFDEVSDATGAENYWPWGLSAGDVNADGYDDVFIASSMCFPYRYSANSLLLNNAGKSWLDAEFAVGIEPRPIGKRMQPWFELDADKRDKDNPLVDGRTGKLVVWSALGSRSSVMLDIDNDGDLDIVTNDFNSPPLVLINDLADGKTTCNWLHVELEGTASNRDGLGAVVTVKAGSLTSHKVNDGQSGYLAQSKMPLYFGLGTATKVDKVEVVWPNGQRQTLPGPIPAHQTIQVRQPVK